MSGSKVLGDATSASGNTSCAAAQRWNPARSRRSSLISTSFAAIVVRCCASCRRINRTWSCAARSIATKAEGARCSSGQKRAELTAGWPWPRPQPAGGWRTGRPPELPGKPWLCVARASLLAGFVLEEPPLSSVAAARPRRAGCCSPSSSAGALPLRLRGGPFWRRA
eukprot:scaffold50788_cov68-Phaeocystis_antarctica.AAC.4